MVYGLGRRGIKGMWDIDVVLVGRAPSARVFRKCRRMAQSAHLVLIEGF
jgi:hypothetical protein